MSIADEIIDSLKLQPEAWTLSYEAHCKRKPHPANDYGKGLTCGCSWESDGQGNTDERANLWAGGWKWFQLKTKTSAYLRHTSGICLQDDTPEDDSGWYVADPPYTVLSFFEKRRLRKAVKEWRKTTLKERLSQVT